MSSWFYDNQKDVYIPYELASTVTNVLVTFDVTDGNLGTTNESIEFECYPWYGEDYYSSTTEYGVFYLEVTGCNHFIFYTYNTNNQGQQVSMDIRSIVYRNSAGTAIYTQSFNPYLHVDPSNTDYEYHYEETYEASGASITSGQTASISINSNVVGYFTVWAWPWEGEGDEIWFKKGTSRSLTKNQVYYSYNGSTSVTVRNNKPDQGGDETISVGYDGHGVGVRPEVSYSHRNKTSYEQLTDTVTNNDITYTIISLRDTYQNCINLRYAPYIYNLTHINSLQRTFSGCSNLEALVGDERTYVPSNVIIMDDCFTNCTKLSLSPHIPSSVTSMARCFSGCTSLKNIYVHNYNILDYADIFIRTSGDIFVVNGERDGSTSANIEAIWKTIANIYSNVHYEAVDNLAPVISSFQALRVEEDQSTEFIDKGTWAYLQASIILHRNLLPYYWHLNISLSSDISFTMDSADETLYWSVKWFNEAGEEVSWSQAYAENTKYIRGTIEAWIDVVNTSSHSFTLKIANAISDDRGYPVPSAKKESVLVSFTLPKAYCLVDYYHDPSSTASEGVAFGKYAEHPDLVDIEMALRVKGDVDFYEGELVSDFPMNIGTHYKGTGTAWDLSSQEFDIVANLSDSSFSISDLKDGMYFHLVMQYTRPSDSFGTCHLYFPSNLSKGVYITGPVDDYSIHWSTGDTLVFKYVSDDYGGSMFLLTQYTDRYLPYFPESVMDDVKLYNAAVASQHQDLVKDDLIYLKKLLGVLLSKRRVLLWTNPHPTSSFSPQTISLDLSDFDYVEIIAKKTASETWYFTTKIPIIGQGNLYFIETGVTFDRNCTLSSAGIEFKTGYYNLATGSLVTDNTRSVPIQIYGIKENI